MSIPQTEISAANSDMVEVRSVSGWQDFLFPAPYVAWLLAYRPGSANLQGDVTCALPFASLDPLSLTLCPRLLFPLGPRLLGLPI